MTRPFRVLAADDERLILEGYRILIEQSVAAAPRHLSELEAQLFGTADTLPASPTPTEVVCVPQAAAAIEQVRRSIADGQPFSLAFIDYHMPPGATGLDAARAIRSLDGSIRIVIASGYTGCDPDEILRQVPPANRISFLPKPFRTRDVFRLVNECRADWDAAGKRG